MTNPDVVALFVDPRGPYPGIVRDWYDEARDARTYTGTLPVVAHPACGPWGRLAHLCTKQNRDDALVAVEQVRRCGGVLEHPKDSRLWRAADMPRPGDGRDAFGGYTIAVEQWWWGHRAIKPTWLYIVGADEPTELVVARGPRPAGGHAKGPGDPARSMTERLCKEERRRTPVAFARWLVDLAAAAGGK